MNTLGTRINCKDLASNEPPIFIDVGGSVSMVHHSADPVSVNRLIVVNNELEVEILPSKGFSIGQVYRGGRPQLWDPPIGFCDTENLDLHSAEIAINGNPAPGFTFLKTFSAGIEFYGLRNWGMPFYDEKNSFLHPIHGETSNIPVDYCDVTISSDEITLTASFIYRNMLPDSKGTWYLSGSDLFEVERRVIIKKDKLQLQLIDRIKNISDKPLLPDWGYHITFMPAPGSLLLVPSASVENRSGEKVPEGFEKWLAAENNSIREEVGIIYKGLNTYSSDFGKLSYAVVIHADQTGIKVSFPVSSYFQTWFCNGGANSYEFTRVSDGKPLFNKNWDGIGIEFGSSALDHNGNTDQSVPLQEFIKQASSIEIPILIDFVDELELKQLSEEIRKDNLNRVFIP